jgi:hypothetical protein
VRGATLSHAVPTGPERAGPTAPPCAELPDAAPRAGRPFAARVLRAERLLAVPAPLARRAPDVPARRLRVCLSDPARWHR